jgi:hypothetical protein
MSQSRGGRRGGAGREPISSLVKAASNWSTRIAMELGTTTCGREEKWMGNERRKMGIKTMGPIMC